MARRQSACQNNLLSVCEVRDDESTPPAPDNTSIISRGSNTNETPASASTSARPNDIICGRGLHIMRHHGNLNLHLVVSRHQQAYKTASRKEKAAITRRIVDKIKSTGARFIRRSKQDSDDDWVEVDDDVACKKVGHALRRRKSDHGKKFLHSVYMQPKKHHTLDNNNDVQMHMHMQMQIEMQRQRQRTPPFTTQSTGRTATGTIPGDVPESPSVRENSSSLQRDSLRSMSPSMLWEQGLSGLPRIPAQALSQQLCQLQHYGQVQSLLSTSSSGYGNLAVDPLLFVQAFRITVAILNHSIDQSATYRV